MQFGDLQEHTQERLFIVIEGVLANVHIEDRKRRWKHEVEYHITWYEVPLKRLIVTKERYDFDIVLVTFISPDFAERAARYLNLIQAPYDGIEYHDYEEFTSILPYQRRLRAVYDSDPDRLEDYGVYGVGVVAGNDW